MMNRVLVLFAVAITGLTPTIRAESPASFAETIERAKASTVAILRDAQPESGPPSRSHFAIRGTGWHLHDGYIITAGHAVEQQKGSQTVMPDQIRLLTHNLFEYPASFVGSNETLDIVVYKLIPDSAPLPVTLFATEEALPGHEVFTVGYPLGWGPAIGFGKMGNPNTFLPTVQSRLYQVDLSTCSGNSGGGLFNRQGEIVGVVHAIIQTETTEGDRRCSRFAFAVPGKLVQQIVTALIHGKARPLSSLGIQLTTIQEHRQWKVAVAKATGPAQAGGVRKGDVIVSINAHPIHTPAELKTYLIEQTSPGQTVTVEIQRGKLTHHLRITLGGL